MVEVEAITLTNYQVQGSSGLDFKPRVNKVIYQGYWETYLGYWERHS